MSSMTCRGSDRTSRSISSSLSRKEAGSQRSKSREYERTAASPRVRISATISATVHRTCCRAFSSADAGRALFSSKAMAQLLHGVRGQTYVCSNPKLLCCVRQAEPSTVAMLSAPCSSPGVATRRRWMVTSHEVARLAGVSQPTVSRALRDSTKVSEQTKRRVREAAAALGYVPSATGRALSMGRSGRLGMLLTDLENQFYQHVMAPMHHALDEVGYQLVLMTESSEAGPIADRIVANGLDGVLLTTTTTDSILPIRLRDRSIPFVYFNRTSSAVEADSVTVDPLPGVQEMVTELVALGHHEVAGIFGPRNTSTGVNRETCIRDQLSAPAITIQPDPALHVPFDF